MNTITSEKGIVSTTNHHASNAALDILNKSGNAIDAAIAASSVLSVTSQHQCGLGGDLFAMIYKNGKVYALNSTGFSGSRIQEYSSSFKNKKIKTFKDPRLITIPGAVDGWLELHRKFGKKKISEIFQRSIELASDGFPCDVSLYNAIESTRNSFYDNPLNYIDNVNQIVKRPKIANQLQLIKKYGRDAFYSGTFGEELVKLVQSIKANDLVKPQFEWVKPISYSIYGQKFWTTPPNSQSFLILNALKIIADKKNSKFKDLDDLQVEICDAMINIGHNRDKYLSNYFNLQGTDTNYLCIVDQEGTGISLVQSNAHGFGSQLVLKDSGIFLHNRGLGFIKNNSVFSPKNNTKPPSTLCPLIITKNRDLFMLTGTMGADSQPQIILQNWAKHYFTNDIFKSLNMPRWIISGKEKQSLFPFNTWKISKNSLNFFYEKGISNNLLIKLKQNKNIKFKRKNHNPNLFGHSQMIVKSGNQYFGHHDPRSITGLTLGL